MNSSALILMILVQGSIAFATASFLIKVLNQSNKKE